MELPRQPLPVKVVISSSDPTDQDAAVRLIHQFLNRHFDDTNRYHLNGATVIDCYPRAVND